MKSLKSAFRWAAVVLGGGMVIQTTGCAAGLAPLLAGYAESAILNLLLAALFGA